MAKVLYAFVAIVFFTIGYELYTIKFVSNLVQPVNEISSESGEMVDEVLPEQRPDLDPNELTPEQRQHYNRMSAESKEEYLHTVQTNRAFQALLDENQNVESNQNKPDFEQLDKKAEQLIKELNALRPSSENGESE